MKWLRATGVTPADRPLGVYCAGVLEADPLVRLVDESRAGHTGEGRERQRVLARMAEEGASLAGTLVDLAERGDPVTVRTASGRSHHGALRSVGTDFVVVRPDRGREVLVHHRAIVSVLPQAGERHLAATGDRTPPLDRCLVDVLAGVAPDRPRLAAVVAGGEVLRGELRSVGADVVTVRLDGEAPSVCYVATAALQEVAIDR